MKAKFEPGLDVSTIRTYLNRWVEERRARRSINHYTEATHPIALPKMPDTDEEEHDGDDEICCPGDARKFGVHFVSWQRSPYQKVGIDYYAPTLSFSDYDKTTIPEQKQSTESASVLGME